MADAVALHDRLGGTDRAVVVGHDWGAITANALAGHDGSPFGRVVSLAVPPLPAMAGLDARLMLRQLRLSWHTVFNQVPWLPERTHERLIRTLWRNWSPGYDAREDLQHVLDALAEPSHRSAAFGYYRAVTRPWTVPESQRPWQASLQAMPSRPLLYLHGADDGCLDVGYAREGCGRPGRTRPRGDRRRGRSLPAGGATRRREPVDRGVPRPDLRHRRDPRSGDGRGDGPRTQPPPTGAAAHMGMETVAIPRLTLGARSLRGGR